MIFIAKWLIRNEQELLCNDNELWLQSSQASRDPSSRKGQVKSNTLTCARGMQLRAVECNYCVTLCLVCGRKYV